MTQSRPLSTTQSQKSSRPPPPGYPLLNHPTESKSPLLSLPLLFFQKCQSSISLSQIWTCTQYGVGLWLVLSIWKEVRDAWDEIVEDVEEKSKRMEDHDLPFVSSEGVDLCLEQELQESTLIDSTSASKSSYTSSLKSTSSQPQKPISKRIRRDAAHVRDLMLRLEASGLPLKSEDEDGKEISVEKVLKSLTRTEGQLLCNTLLSPPSFSISNAHANANAHNHTHATPSASAWDNIGGLTHIKEALLDLIYPLLHHNPTLHPYGELLSHPPGVLLYGPPGCGKTMLARALTHSTNARCLCITPSTLFRKYVGETNLNVRAIFSLAQKISPCLILIEELDGLFRERVGDEHEVSREVKTEFLSLWDGIQGNPQNVIVIGATNRPFDVDPAFLRRMPRSFFVGLPDVESRIAILNNLLDSVPLYPGKEMIPDMARGLEGYSGSDIKEVLRTAALFPLREARQSSEGDHLPPLRSLMMEDIQRAMERVSPTPLSISYRAALTEYANGAHGRGNGFGMQEEMLEYNRDRNSFFPDPPRPNGYYPSSNDHLESELSESSSSSLEEDDDYF